MCPSSYSVLLLALPIAELATTLSDNAARQKHYELTGGDWERRPQRRGTTGGQDEPTGRRRKDGSRQGWRVRTVRRPQGVTRAPREAGREGSRTPGLLRGGRPPPDASARTGNLKLPLAWRAKPAQGTSAAIPNPLRVNLLSSETRSAPACYHNPLLSPAHAARRPFQQRREDKQRLADTAIGQRPDRYRTE